MSEIFNIKDNILKNRARNRGTVLRLIKITINDDLSKGQTLTIQASKDNNYMDIDEYGYLGKDIKQYKNIPGRSFDIKKIIIKNMVK